MECGRLETPTGPLWVVSSAHGIRVLGWEPHGSDLPSGDPFGALPRLQAWFAGDLGALDRLPVDPEGTPFQRRVWSAVRRVPPGTITTYGALAADLGSVARAVGRANAANPVAIVVPCHRVIGGDGSLTGYGGGIERKRWLLAHERAPGFGLFR